MLQNGMGKTQSRVKMLIAVIGRLVIDIRISDTAKLHIKTEQTDERVTLTI